MTLHWQADLIALAVVAVTCWLLPWLAAGPAIGAFRKAGKVVRNYRGADVPLGLGVLWIVWAAGIAIATGIGRLMVGRSGETVDLAAGGLTAATGLFAAVATGAVVIAGLADDLYGTASDKGLKGHFKALREGRVTTGLAKLVVIVIAAALACLPLAIDHRPSGWAATPGPLSWTAAVIVVAGTANLLNLLDLRPGRSLKVYLVLLAAVVPALVVVPFASASLPKPSGLDIALLAAAAAAGPAVVCLRRDLAERSMLGDAGANAAGFVVGLLFAHAYSDVTLWVAAAVVVVLNVLSERVSFSKVIDATPALRAFDMWGRRAPEDDGDDGVHGSGAGDTDPWDSDEPPRLPRRDEGPWDHWS